LDTEKKVSKDFCIHKVKLAKFYKSSDVLETYFKFKQVVKKKIFEDTLEIFEIKTRLINIWRRYLYFDIPIEIKINFE
jgi:hypothetical protein